MLLKMTLDNNHILFLTFSKVDINEHVTLWNAKIIDNTFPNGSPLRLQCENQVQVSSASFQYSSLIVLLSAWWARQLPGWVPYFPISGAPPVCSDEYCVVIWLQLQEHHKSSSLLSPQWDPARPSLWNSWSHFSLFCWAWYSSVTRSWRCGAVCKCCLCVSSSFLCN